MKNLFGIGLVMLFVSASLFAQKEMRTLTSFTKLDVSGGISVELVQSSAYKAEVTIIQGEMDALITDVNNGTLNISFERKSGNNWGSGEKARIILHTGNLATIETSAGAKVDGKAMTNTIEAINLEASSGSNIAIKVEAGKAETKASSGAKITLSGTTTSLVASVSSGANIDCSLLNASTATAEASSGGKITLWPSENLKASASSGGSIKYKGEPKNLELDKDKYSGGNISKM